MAVHRYWLIFQAKNATIRSVHPEEPNQNKQYQEIQAYWTEISEIDSEKLLNCSWGFPHN